MRIGDSERIAARAVAGAEPAFVVGAPGLIGGVDRGERPRIARRAYARGSAMRQPGALQHLADRAFGGPDDMRMRSGELHPQLSRPPVPSLPRGDDVRDHFLAQPAREMPRHATAVGQPRHTLSIVARQPLVNRLARDPIDLGQRRDALALVVILNQLDTEVHGSVLLPRHCF